MIIIILKMKCFCYFAFFFLPRLRFNVCQLVRGLPDGINVKRSRGRLGGGAPVMHAPATPLVNLPALWGMSFPHSERTVCSHCPPLYFGNTKSGS